MCNFCKICWLKTINNCLGKFIFVIDIIECYTDEDCFGYKPICVTKAGHSGYCKGNKWHRKYRDTKIISRDIYRLSLHLIIIVLENVVYGSVRDGRVYYQIANRNRYRLECYYKKRDRSASWTEFGEATYHKGYAQCPAWERGNPEYDIRLDLCIGRMVCQEHSTDEETAISNGPYPVKSKLHKSKVPNTSIL